MDQLKAELTHFPFDSNWVNGTVGPYSFEAKLFDDASTYGIGNGRVSKLAIYDNNLREEKRDFLAACIINYDRGWDIRATKETRPFLDVVISLLESLPRRFDHETAVN